MGRTLTREPLIRPVLVALVAFARQALIGLLVAVFAAFGKLMVRMLAGNLDHDVAVADAFDRREHDRLLALNRAGRKRRPDRARRRVVRPDRKLSCRAALTREPLIGMSGAREALVRMSAAPTAAGEPLVRMSAAAVNRLLQCDDRPKALWHGSS
jgi:hypothetical protein